MKNLTTKDHKGYHEVPQRKSLTGPLCSFVKLTLSDFVVKKRNFLK